MIFGMTPYQIGWYFLIYSFLGWSVEVAFHAIRFHRVINRGFLNGPVCPVYGFGVLLVFAAGNLVSGTGAADNNIFVLFILGIVLATFVELLGGFFLDKCFHARWWDYSDEKFNFHGYICLRFSIIWGVGIVLIVKILHPMVRGSSVDLLPDSVGLVLMIALLAGYMADFIVSVLIMVQFNKHLKELDEVRTNIRTVSNAITMVIGEGTFVAENILDKTAPKVKARLLDASGMGGAGEDDGSPMDNQLESREEFEVKAEKTAAAVKEVTNGIREKSEELRANAEETKDYILTELQATQLETLAEADAKAAELLAKITELEAKRRDILKRYEEGAHSAFRRVLRAHPDLKQLRYEETFARLKERAEQSLKEIKNIGNKAA